MRTTPPLPTPVKRSLQKLGRDISDARRRRRIPMQLMAERAAVSRVTLSKVEKGDAAVSMGIYATVLFILGLNSRLYELADANFDELGRAMEEEHLPKRIRIPKQPDDQE